eukprot:6072158-Karenia_brevis.AAC.1
MVMMMMMLMMMMMMMFSAHSLCEEVIAEENNCPAAHVKLYFKDGDDVLELVPDHTPLELDVGKDLSYCIENVNVKKQTRQLTPASGHIAKAVSSESIFAETVGDSVVPIDSDLQFSPPGSQLIFPVETIVETQPDLEAAEPAPEMAAPKPSEKAAEPTPSEKAPEPTPSEK